MGERYLKGTMVLEADASGRGRVVPRGTPESELSAADRKLIPESKWITPEAAFEIEEPEIVSVESLDSLGYDGLAAIAEREGISIGRLKDPEKIRIVLRQAGIGVGDPDRAVDAALR